MCGCIHSGHQCLSLSLHVKRNQYTLTNVITAVPQRLQQRILRVQLYHNPQSCTIINCSNLCKEKQYLVFVRFVLLSKTKVNNVLRQQLFRQCPISSQTLFTPPKNPVKQPKKTYCCLDYLFIIILNDTWIILFCTMTS